jgi:hypothetical protein
LVYQNSPQSWTWGEPHPRELFEAHSKKGVGAVPNVFVKPKGVEVVIMVGSPAR